MPLEGTFRELRSFPGVKHVPIEGEIVALCREDPNEKRIEFVSINNVVCVVVDRDRFGYAQRFRGVWPEPALLE